MKHRMMWVVCVLLILPLTACQEDPPLSPETGQDVTADKSVISRSFDEFLAAQGTFCWPSGDPDDPCYVFNPPVPNFGFWYEPGSNESIWPDYAGIVAQWVENESAGAISLGTTITGHVTERSLPDGRALVHVSWRAADALAWCFDFTDGIIAPEVVLLGNMPQDVVYDSATPALGNFELNARFIISAPGAPLPDLMEVAFFPQNGQELVFWKASGVVRGDLHELAGYPEGTPGMAQFTMTYVGQSNSHSPHWDGYPAEFVHIRPLE